MTVIYYPLIVEELSLVFGLAMSLSGTVVMSLAL